MSVTTVPMLANLKGPWSTFRVEFVGGATEVITDVYPFLSVNDLKRMIWIAREGDPRWAPERVFLGVRTATGFRPIEFHWPTTVGEILPDPLAADRMPSDALVDAQGSRKPVGVTMLGALTLEGALAPELLTDEIPVVTAIPLSAIAPDVPEAMTAALFNGFYYMYFPWLTEPAAVLDANMPSAALRDAYAAAVPYLEDRIGRIEIVERSLAAGVAGPSMGMTTMTRLQWLLPPPAAKPESLERTFYALKTSEMIPFLRFFPAQGQGSPILKLGLKEDGTPIMTNDRVLSMYINEPAPSMKSAVILAKIPIRSEHVEAGSAFTLYMFEDGACDITLETAQRGATYIAAVAAEAERTLGDVIRALGFPGGTHALVRDIHATYKWTHPNASHAAPLSAAKIATRVASLTPFLDPVPTLDGETALATFSWRAVSNYESETAQFAFITQMVLRRGFGGEGGASARHAYEAELSRKFGIPIETAAATLERWFERRGEAVAPAASAGALAVAKHSTGCSVAISGAHPTYTIEVQGAETLPELQRILSTVGVLLGATPAQLAIAPPAAVVSAVNVAVEIADDAVAAAVVAAGGGAVPEEDAELAEMDPAMAAMLAELGLGGDDDEVPEEGVIEPAAAEVEAAVAAAGPPDVEAAEGECSGTRWTADEPALKLPPDYYMARLKNEDIKLFGYSVMKSGRKAGFARSCSRTDERQPNIMTLAQYARVKRCYADLVRFVDLPPRQEADLPRIPDYNPKRKVPDELFMTDPETGKPMWTIYASPNRTRPGEFSFLICAELWCERDNLPLLRSEFEGTQGRGFSKPANSCPFCGGATIRNLESPRSGESVIVREPKGATGKVHTFIGTLQRGILHPEGFPVPCCDTTPRLLREYMEEAFYGRLVYGKELGGAAEAGDELPEPAPEVAAEVAVPAAAGIAPGEEPRIDYSTVLGSMPTQYILGADKVLAAGKIGMVPTPLDAFFGQASARSVESRGIRPTFVDGATLFVRVGVDSRNRQPGMNLFAGMAPLLGFTSAEATMRHILGQRMVRAFEAANYGTLVLEFAAQSTLTDAEVAGSLPAFAAEFNYPLGPARAHVARLYRAWVAYLKYLADTQKPKQLRHIEHLLAQPGVIMPRGLLLATLEQRGDKIEVVCPTFGIPTASIFGDVPVAFMWHNVRLNTWEPIVLYNGTKEAVRYFGERSGDLEVLPPPMKISLQRWMREWRSSSLGCGRPAPPPHVWTPDRDTTGLPRLSNFRARLKNGAAASAFVRDRSNRLAGIMMTKGANQFFVPCLDDGILGSQLPRIYEAEMIQPAPLDAYLGFYRDLAELFPALAPARLLSRDSNIIGFQTEIGSMVPVTPQAVGAAQALPIQQMDAFPWERDTLILRAPNAPAMIGAEEPTASVEAQMNEAYQYLRLTLSRWLIRDARGPILRKAIAALVPQSSGLLLYERRKRLDIILEPYIREWLGPEQTEERKPMSLLREDCVALPDEETCAAAGACRWSGGRCLIHAPYRTAGTDVVRIFAARLSDEILRYAGLRQELMEGRVASIRTPQGIVRQGDALYMATKPKDSGAVILEKLGFTGRMTGFTVPEEVMRLEGMEDDAEPAAVAAAYEEVGAEPAPAEETLPKSWIEKGLTIPKPAPGVEDARSLAFAAGTGRSMEDWTKILKIRRIKFQLPGDPDRPFQWSLQDLWCVAMATSCNIIFADQGPDGRARVRRWIAPSTGAVAVTQPIFCMFWGPRQLLVSGRNGYKFNKRDLPDDLLAALDVTAPLPDEQVKGSIEESESSYVSNLSSSSSAPKGASSAAEADKGQLPPDAPAMAEAADKGQLPPPAEAANLETGAGQLPPPQEAPKS
jgi:hypothetical protein